MPLAVETVNKRHKKKKVVDQWRSLEFNPKPPYFY